ncbi:MAG: hypothetical protein JSS81_00760 [Acidobacteria bacterium]|nr:hypothetical protein [Acidobacteriota bacterium]
MNFELQIAIAAIFFGVLGCLLAAVQYRKLGRQRELIEFVGQQVEDLEETLAKNRELLDTNAQRVAEQARRVAWLETRVRQPKKAAEPPPDEHAAADPAKLTMTERRHRVITLAARGQNVDTIATTLGMLPGEVELIINLNQSTQQPVK